MFTDKQDDKNIPRYIKLAPGPVPVMPLKHLGVDSMGYDMHREPGTQGGILGIALHPATRRDEMQ